MSRASERRTDQHTSREGDGGTVAERLSHVRRRFAEFAAEYASLPLYGRVARHVSRDAEAAALLTSAAPGQARPVLWFAALHDLVLRRPDVPAARWYASVVGRDALPSGDPWPDVRATVLDHAAELRGLVASRTTQTNEVNRSVYLAAGLAAACERSGAGAGAGTEAGTEVALVELGASAGLLLNPDRYRVSATGADGRARTVGDPTSTVRCEGADRTAPGHALRPLPAVVSRVGLDRHPVPLDDDEAVRWLRACLWPDVPGRVERFDAALELLRPDPPLVLEGDLVDDVGRAVDTALARAATPPGHVIVFSSWALTYVERQRRTELALELARIAADLPERTRLTWLSAEPPGCVPGLPEDHRALEGPTVLGLRGWDGTTERAPRVIGVAHPHGAWVNTW